MSTSPFSLLLEISKQDDGLPQIKALLKNNSTSSQLYHHSYMYQQSELLLFDSTGTQIKSYDYRERKDYDHTIYGKDSFHLLAPAEEVEIDHSRLSIDQRGDHFLEWGPFQFSSLKQGKYSAFLVFESYHDYWTDQKTKERHSLKIWAGKIESNTIGFTI